MNNRLRLFGLLAALAASASPLAAQGSGVPCDPNVPAPFLSAANDISYGCGYLLESTPPEYVLSESYFREAIRKEPENAVTHFLLHVSYAGQGKQAEAREALATAMRLDPGIAERAEAFYARRPALRSAVEGVTVTRAAPPAPPAEPVQVQPTAPTRPAAPATPPAAAPGTAAPPQVFPVGARVEVQYRAGEWFPGVVTSVDASPCPYYHVLVDAYGNGDPSDLGYFCGSVRAPTGVRQPVAQCGGSNPNCKPTSPPPLGRYTCNVTRWDVAERRVKFDYKGYFELLSGGRYRWLDNGGMGTYAYNPTSHVVTWRSGHLQGLGGKSEYGLDGRNPEITITSEGSSPIVWQCARED